MSTENKRLKEYRATRNLRHQIVKKPSATSKDEDLDDVEFDELTEAGEKSTRFSTRDRQLSIMEETSVNQNNEGDSTLELYMPPIDSINETMRKLSSEIQNDFNPDASILLKVESANVSQLNDEEMELLLGYDEYMQAVFE